MYPQDKVLSKDGKQVGVSTWVGYSSNERKQLTLAYLEPEFAKPGTEVTFVWGEDGWRLEEAHRREPQAGADPRDRLPGAVRGLGAHGLRGRQLARDGQAVSFSSASCPIEEGASCLRRPFYFQKFAVVVMPAAMLTVWGYRVNVMGLGTSVFSSTSGSSSLQVKATV